MGNEVVLASGLVVPAATAQELLGTYLTSRKTRSRNALSVSGNKDVQRLIDAFHKSNPAEIDIGITPITSASRDGGFLAIQNARLYDSLDEISTRDSTVSATLEIIESNIMTREERFEIDDESDEEMSEIRKACEDDLFKMEGPFSWNALKTSLLMGTIRHGFSVNEIVWKLRTDGGERYAPSAFLHRHPGQFAFDEMGNLFVAAPSSVRRGNNLTTDPDTGLLRIGDYLVAPPNKFAVMRAPGMYSNPFGKSAVYPLRFLYLFKREAIKAWILFTDNYGTPMAKGMIKGGDEYDELMTELEDKLEGLKRNGGVVLSERMDIEFIDRQAGMKSPPHPQFIEWVSREEVRQLNGATLSMLENEKTGSLSMARVHESTTETRMKPSANRLQETIQQCVVNTYVRLRFGDNAPIPQYVIDTTDIIDVESAIKTINAAGDLGIDVLTTQATEMLGITQPGPNDDTVSFKSLKEKADGTAKPVSEGDDADIIEAEFEGNAKSETISDEVLKFQISRSEEEDYIERYQKIASILSDQISESFRKQMAKYLATIEASVSDPDLPLGATVMAVDFGVVEIAPDTENGFVSAKILAAMINFSRIDAVVPDKFTNRPGDMHKFAHDPFEDIPNEFAPAADWMLSRAIMTRAEISLMANALAQLYPLQTEDFFERQLREDLFALSLGANKEVVRRIRDTLSDAVRDGKSLSAFLAVMDEFTDAGLTPIIGDHYWENVYRTEVSSQYAYQRDLQMSNPDIAANYWGDELFNPRGPNSRQTHMDINGVFLQRGSAAHVASKDGPPWAYQCLCARSPVIVPDITKSGFTETEGALGLVVAIERFT